MTVGAVGAVAAPRAAKTLIGFVPRAASAPGTKWTVRVYASAASPRVLASCSATAAAGQCTVGQLVRGRTFYMTVVKTGAAWPVVKKAIRIKVRVL